MKERSTFTGWLTKLVGPPDQAQLVPSDPPQPVRPAVEAHSPLDIARPLDEMRAQLARCFERLDRIDTHLQDSRQHSTSEENRVRDEEENRRRREEERLRREEQRLRRESEELRAGLQKTQDGLQWARERLAERDAQIEQLTRLVQNQEQQLAAAETNGQRLQAALTAEQQTRQVHESAKAAAYRELKQSFTATVQRAVPGDTTVLVVSKGDDQLLELDGRQAWHFPRAENGKYAGYHPKDSEAAIAQLEALRAKGAQYLVFPATAAWWLDHYKGFKQHLETQYTSVPTHDDSCHIFALGSAAESSEGASSAAADGPYRELEAAVESFRNSFHRPPAILDWNSGLRLAGHHAVFSPPSSNGTLPYLDRTIDMVLCGPTAGELEEARRVASAAVVAVDGASVAVEWVTTRSSRALDASIIIPCFNGAALTEACLTALTASLPRDFEGEIIVFDDASTDGTREMVKGWTKRDPRIQLRRRHTNAGFLDACNRAAKTATREYLVFLNNDTEPCQGWLTALLDTFRRFPNAGAVGGKLILSDGTLQEAGSVIFQDGSAANFMRGETNLDAPLINYVRDVDYCSGALLATPRRLFAELGGFDVRYKPAYYEDVDYCFKVRQAGHRVYYQPASKVIHREGGSCGTDVTRGVKRYQVRNQRTFTAQWKDALHKQPVRPRDGDDFAWRALAGRRAESLEAP